MDDGEFSKFAAGELDLPSESEDVDMESADEGNDDLDDYYRELGIDPKEMRDPKAEAVYETKKKASAGPTKRSQVID